MNNNMKLHNNKFEYINFNTRTAKFPLENLPFYNQNFQYITSDDNILERSPSLTDLGVTISEDLKWSSHVSTLATKAKRKAGWVLCVFKARSPFVMKTLYKSIVRSQLEYACPVWTGLSIGDIQQLESVQRSFTNKIDCPSHVSDYWERLKFLNLMSLQRRRERYVILHMWKILNCKVSNDIDVTFRDSARFGKVAIIPPIHRSSSVKAQTMYDASFAVRGPTLWNTLPKLVKSYDKLNTFKVNLDKYLKDIPDRPPVSGYVTQNHNSLVDWHNTQY